MVKMIPHHLIAETSFTKPIFGTSGDWFRRDDPVHVIDIACEGAAIIPRSTLKFPIMAFLVENNLFDYEDEANILYLPINKREAAILGRSPFGDPPIESYLRGIVELMERVAETKTFAAAQAGDAVSIAKVLGTIRDLQVHLRAGLIKGEVFIAFPYNADDRARDEIERTERKIQ